MESYKSINKAINSKRGNYCNSVNTLIDTLENKNSHLNRKAPWMLIPCMNVPKVPKQPHQS